MIVIWHLRARSEGDQYHLTGWMPTTRQEFLADFFSSPASNRSLATPYTVLATCLSDAGNFKPMKWRNLIFILAGGVLIGLEIGFWNMKLQTRQASANDASGNRPISSALSMTSCAIALAPHKVPSRAEYQTGPDPEATENQNV